MELHLSNDLYPQAITTLLALLFFIYFVLRWKKPTTTTTTKKNPPQPSGAYPLIGHLLLLGNLPHISLSKLSDTYGPIFLMKLGLNRALVVSSSTAAKECLITNDKLFATRPQTIFVEHLGYNSAMFGFSPYGSYWREIRKIVTIEVLSNHRLEKLKNVRISEVSSGIKTLYDVCKSNGSHGRPCLVDMKNWFNELTLNSSVRLIAGKSLKELYKGEEEKKWRKALREFFELSAAFLPADALPFLRWFDIGGYEREMKRAKGEIDKVIQSWVDEHRKRREFVEGSKEMKDFIDVMLGMFEGEEQMECVFGVDTNTIIKATSMAMILGATDTTAVTLTWALSLLLNNKQSLQKAQSELDTIVGKQRRINEQDIKKLVYIQAIVKETLRLYPAAPLSVPREAISDCTINGYHIPARTRLFVNLYKIHRDPKIWVDPLEFRPERFLTSHVDYDVRGQNPEYIPFGAGRRICPGISLSMQMLQYTIANLLHCFDLQTECDKVVDMTEGYGMTNLKATPLEVMIKPRLPDHVYNDDSI